MFPTSHFQITQKRRKKKKKKKKKQQFFNEKMKRRKKKNLQAWKFAEREVLIKKVGNQKWVFWKRKEDYEAGFLTSFCVGMVKS